MFDKAMKVRRHQNFWTVSSPPKPVTECGSQQGQAIDLNKGTQETCIVEGIARMRKEKRSVMLL